MTETEKAQALEALRLGWHDVYEFGAGSDGFWARRRDGIGETIIDEDPGEVRRQVQENYTETPRRA